MSKNYKIVEYYYYEDGNKCVDVVPFENLKTLVRFINENKAEGIEVVVCGIYSTMLDEAVVNKLFDNFTTNYFSNIMIGFYDRMFYKLTAV